jgi:hypothetical protein
MDSELIHSDFETVEREGDKQDLCFDCQNTLKSWWEGDIEA